MNVRIKSHYQFTIRHLNVNTDILNYILVSNVCMDEVTENGKVRIFGDTDWFLLNLV